MATTKQQPVCKHLVRTVADKLGLSPATVRMHCKNTKELKPLVQYHSFGKGTTRGYYTLSNAAISWLRKNVDARSKKVDRDA